MSMVTRTERYYAHDVVGGVRAMEDSYWAVRQIVPITDSEESGGSYTTAFLVVFERSV